MSSIASRLQEVLSTLRKGVELVAVSKTKPIEDIQEAYDAGQRDFGENKIQEMASKWEALPNDIRWHMIGHVQTNKVKYMAAFVHLVHGVDRDKVLQELDKQAAKAGRIVDCTLQVHIAMEETKFGYDASELAEVIGRLNEFPNVRVVGLMGMATNTDDMALVRKEFSALRELFVHYGEERGWSVLSMGMSGDYIEAMECGSTHVRIGSAIFGARNYAL
ncbi:MAG: hypothetical protein RL754_528 [Bacteroidota bacterium]